MITRLNHRVNLFFKFQRDIKLNPRFWTTDLQKGAKFPKSERTWDSEFPNQITSVFDLNKKWQCQINDNIHYIAKRIGSPPSNERFDYFSNFNEYKS